MKTTLGLCLSVCIFVNAYAQQPSAGHLTSAQAETATLKAKFIYDGSSYPKPQKVQNLDRDPFCAALDVRTENMLIGENGEIKNLAIYMYNPSKGDIPENLLEAPKEKIVLDNRGCVFIPHVLVVRPGQTISVVNSDETGHNANFNFFINNAWNNLIPAGSSKDLVVREAEPAPIPVECNIHPWMRAYVFVQDHPYVGVTDEKGELTIENLPVGEFTFRIWHENAVRSIDEGTVGGKKESWRRGRMEIELKPGMNDLGTIKIAADKFKS